MNDKISLIIPTYKRNFYLKKCLDSLSIQSTDKSKYEIIVVDNDKENEITNLIKNFRKRGVDLTYVKNVTNNVSSARNLGISLSKYKNLLFIGDDIYVCRDFIKQHLSFLRKYNFHCFQDKQQFTWIKMPKSLEESIDRSQKYQAYLLKYHTEFYRKHKFNPCNGALQFVFNDCWPAITWSIIDYYRNKKPGYYALKQAFSPIHVIIEWPDERVLEKEFRRGIYVVNDYHRRFNALRVSYTVSSDGEIVKKENIDCAIEENALKKVGSIELQFSTEDVGREISIDLELLDKSDLLSSNNYRFNVKEVR